MPTYAQACMVKIVLLFHKYSLIIMLIIAAEKWNITDTYL